MKALCFKWVKLCSMLTCTISASIFFAFPAQSSPSILDTMLQTRFSNVSASSSDRLYGDFLNNCNNFLAFDWDFDVPWTVSSRRPGITPSFNMISLYLFISLSHMVRSAPAAYSRPWREPSSITSTSASTPPSSDVRAILPLSKATRDSRMAQHFSAVLEDLLQLLRTVINGGIICNSRMVSRLLGMVERL